MSMSICAMTGQALRQPMASLKTGHLYEKQVIEKHLNSFPYCPITNQPMGLEDLVQIVPFQGSYVRTDQSAIAYLHKLQQEYDVLAVEAFSLRKNLRETEEELTSSLYQNEAANRVIAKLLKEKQEAESEMAKLEGRIAELKGRGDQQ